MLESCNLHIEYISYMSGKHPVDLSGRALPRSDWPPEKHAPPRLETVRRFINTANLESGADRLYDSADFDDWLIQWGHAPIGASNDELARLATAREALRDAAIAHRDAASDRIAVSAFQSVIGGIPLVMSLDTIDLALRPDVPPGTVDHLLGTIAIAVVGALDDGTWNRLKACATCRWVVYDHSRNLSGRWCSMSACGGRAKIRNHRARARSDSSG